MNSVPNIRKLREENELTQEEVCRKLADLGCFIDRSTYAKYELGSRTPSVEIIKKLAVCFNVSTDYLLGLSDIKKSS